MKTFNAGDCVKVIAIDANDEGHVSIGMIGTVLEVSSVPYVGFDVPTKNNNVTQSAAFYCEINWPLENVWPLYVYQLELVPDVKIVCPRCGSDDVVGDAWVRWDIKTQSWQISGIFDDKTCQKCNYESHTFNEEVIK